MSSILRICQFLYCKIYDVRKNAQMITSKNLSRIYIFLECRTGWVSQLQHVLLHKLLITFKEKSCDLQLIRTQFFVMHKGNNNYTYNTRWCVFSSATKMAGAIRTDGAKIYLVSSVINNSGVRNLLSAHRYWSQCRHNCQIYKCFQERKEFRELEKIIKSL